MNNLQDPTNNTETYMLKLKLETMKKELEKLKSKNNAISILKEISLLERFYMKFFHIISFGILFKNNIHEIQKLQKTARAYVNYSVFEDNNSSNNVSNLVLNLAEQHWLFRMA